VIQAYFLSKVMPAAEKPSLAVWPHSLTMKGVGLSTSWDANAHISHGYIRSSLRSELISKAGLFSLHI
jgi:hypothetical protein